MIKNGFTYKKEGTKILVWSDRISDWYTVDLIKKTCNCIGFKFRHTCNHYNTFKNEIKTDKISVVKKLVEKKLNQFDIIRIIGEEEFDKLIASDSIIVSKNKVFVI